MEHEADLLREAREGTSGLFSPSTNAIERPYIGLPSRWEDRNTSPEDATQTLPPRPKAMPL